MEQSIGEAIDKFTILGIKVVKLDGKHADFAKMERDSIYASLIDAGVCGFREDKDYEGLLNINTELWDLENDIRAMEIKANDILEATYITDVDKYVMVSRQIRELNETRAHHKNQLNKTFGSKFQEVKCYSGFETEV